MAIIGRLVQVLCVYKALRCDSRVMISLLWPFGKIEAVRHVSDI